jgi:V/A-type H+/Na+-transporting ATPase subunit E
LGIWCIFAPAWFYKILKKNTLQNLIFVQGAFEGAIGRRDHNIKKEHVMETKLQELTEKIYREGVERAEAEAHRITTEAAEEAARLLAQARQQADAMLTSAQQESEDLRRNSFNELQLASRQLESDLRQKISQLIEMNLVPNQTAPLFRDPAFVRELILKAAGKWNPHSGEPVSLEVLLPKDLLQQVEQFAKEGASAILGKGVKFSASEKAGQGFQIGPAGGGYRISFTDEDFNMFFRTYLRPKLREMLFGKEEKQDAERA